MFYRIPFFLFFFSFFFLFSHATPSSIPPLSLPCLSRLCLHFSFSSIFLTPSLFIFLGQVAGKTLPYDSLPDIRARLQEVSPTLVRYGAIEPANFVSVAAQLAAAVKTG